MVTGSLILLPGIYFFLFEFAREPVGKRLLLSFFQAVTPRTAGFNTADLTAMSESGQTIITMLMLIGGSPGLHCGRHENDNAGGSSGERAGGFSAQ